MIATRAPVQGWGPALTTGVLYLAAAWVCLAASRGTSEIVALWVPNAILLCAMLRDTPRRSFAYVTTCAAASIAANAWFGVEPAAVLAFTAANMLTPIVTVVMLRKLHTGTDAFESLAGTWRFVLSLTVAVLCGSTVAATVAAANGARFGQTWQNAASSDWLGTLLMSAFILTLTRKRSDEITDPVPAKLWQRVWPLLVVAGGSALVFWQSQFPLLFLPLIALLFATFRLGRPGAVAGLLVVGVIGTASLMFGHGPVALMHASMMLKMQFFQFYLIMMFVTCLPLAVLLAERRRLAQEHMLLDLQHRQIIERSSEVLFETDAAGRWTYLNPAWEAVTGHPSRTSIGHSFLSFIVPDDREQALANLAKLHDGAIDECRQEIRYMHASAGLRWASFRSRLIRDAAGVPSGAHGTLHDITEHRLLDEARRESERLYRLLADNSNDMIVRLDLAGVRKYVSPASRHLLGYEPDELIGLTPAGEIHPDDRSGVIKTCMALVTDPTNANPICVYRQRRKDGSYIWLEATYHLVHDVAGEPFEAIASVRDVSRREAAELENAKVAAQMQESHRLLLMSEEMGEIGHWRVDIASQTVFWSDAVCTIHGVPMGYRPALETAIDAYHPDDRSAVAELVERALTTGEDFANAARILRPDGSLRHVLSRGRVEKAPDGTNVGLFGVFQDTTAAHEATLALVESERRYKMLADYATDIVLCLGPEGECIFVSPSVAEVTGFSPLELSNTRLSDRIHESDGANVRQTTRNLRAQLGTTAIFEFRFQHRDGRWIWLEANLRAKVEAGSDEVVLIGSARLIEQRKAAEAKAEDALQKLYENNQLLNMAEAVAHVGHWRIDTIAQTLFWSDEVYRIYGLHPDTVPTLDGALALYHPDDAAKVREMLKQAFTSGTSYVSSARIIRPDGSIVYTSTRGEIDRNSAGEVTGLFGIIQDVTEQKAAQARRAEREARFRLITEQASDMISLHDPDGRIVFMSPSARTILGYEPADMIGTLVGDYTIPDDHAVLVDHSRQLLGQRIGAVTTSRFRLRRKNDSLVWIEVASRRVEYEGAYGSLRICRDVTEQVRTEAELRKAQAAAEAAAMAKSAFLATMSHEIRTPMTGVLGMVELLRSDDVDPAQRTRFFNTLEQSAKTLMTVLDDILDYSKIESGNLMLETVDFDMGILAQNVSDLFQNAASAKGLALSVKTQSAHSCVRGDPTRIQQVLSNLVSNAIKFTESGGVSITVGSKQASDTAYRWRIEVADSGIGVDATTSDQLFSPFVQADVSTTRRFGGTGLGLSISKRLVGAMGGEIGVRPGPGGGSVFWFELPLDAGLAAPSAASVTPAAETAPLSVLVAEDNEVNQLLLTALLRRLGHTPTCVANGELAVSEVQVGSYDVILMDMQMPVMDGVAATRAIRGLEGPLATIPIIALTADALPERRRFYENVGLTEFLTKPVDVGRLATALGSVVPRATSIDKDGEAAPLDAGRLAELRSVLDEETVTILLDMIGREATTKPASIRNLCDAGDLAGAANEAHALSGAAGNIGAAALAQIAARLEQAPDIVTAKGLLSELDAAAEALLAVLRVSTACPAVAEAR